MKAAKQAGMTIILGWDFPDRDYPVYLKPGTRHPGAGLVFFPKSEMDDYDLFGRFSNLTSSQMHSIMMTDFQRINALGGLYKLNYHSQYLAVEHFPQTVETTIKKILSYPGVWPATAGEIADWVKGREGLELTATSTPSTVTLQIRNVGLNPVKGATARILPPRDIPAELMEPKQVSQSCEYDVVNGAMIVTLPTLKPGSAFAMEIGSSDGRGLSASNKRLLGTILKIVAVVGGIFVLWFVFYMLFPKKAPSTQSGRERPAKVQKPPKRSAPAPEPIVESSPAKISGIRFEAVPSSERGGKSDLKQSESLRPAGISASSAKPLIITASTVDEETPELKPHVKSLKIAPSRRASFQPPQVKVEPVPVLEEEFAIAEPTVAIPAAQAGSASAAFLRAMGAPEPPAPRPMPIVGTRVVPTAATPAAPPPVSVVERPASPSRPTPLQAPKRAVVTAGGLRTTAAPPKKSAPRASASVVRAPAKASDAFSPQPPAGKASPGRLRTSADILASRRGPTPTNSEEEWR